jgi:tetratricopeptide (TPR) repeat protein
MVQREDVVARVEHLVDEAIAAASDGRAADASQLLDIAIEMLEAVSDGGDMDVAHCLLLRARLMRHWQRLGAARRDALRARGILGRLAPTDDVARLRMDAHGECAAIEYADGKLESARTELLAALDGEPAEQESLLYQLGLVLHRLGQPAESERYWRRALMLLESRSDAGYRAQQHVIAQRALAAVRGLRGRAREAEALIQRAIDLAQTPWRSGPVISGATKYRRGLRALRTALGDADVEIGFVRGCLGASLAAQGKLAAAAAELTIALGTQEGSVGATHVDVALTVYYLAHVRLCQGHLLEAGSLCARAAAGVVRLGADHPRAVAVRKLSEAIEAARARHLP